MCIRDSHQDLRGAVLRLVQDEAGDLLARLRLIAHFVEQRLAKPCLLYTSDAADDLSCVDLGGRRIIKN